MPQIGSLFVNLSMNTAQFTAATQTASVGLNNIAVNSRKTQFALTNLSFQLNDVVSGLASGQDVMRIFAQQAGQIFQAFQQGGGFKTVSRAIIEMITPTRVAVGVVAALAAGFTALAVRALNAEDRVRGFNVMLKGLGDTGKSTGVELEAAAKRLRDVGLSTTEAMTAMQAARRAGISINQVERVTRIGQDLIPALGQNAPQELIGALTGGVDAAAKFLRQLGLIGNGLGQVSAREIEAAKQTEELTGRFTALDRWVGLIEARVKGLNKDALSPAARAMRELGIAWSNALDELSKTAPIQALVGALKSMAEWLEKISKFEMSPDLKNMMSGAAKGAAVGGVLGWFAPEIGIPLGAIGGALVGGMTGAPGRDPAVATAAIPGGRGDPRNKEAVIRYWASYFGHDPDTAVKVARSEGLATYTGDKGTSFGAFQLHVGGGLGDQYRRETGRDPSNPANEDDMIRFSMERLRTTGWGPYHGAARVGVGLHTGIGGAGTGGVVRSDAEVARDLFTAARARATGDLAYGTTVETLGENALATGLRSGGGARIRSRVAAEQEVATRFRGETSSEEARRALTMRSQEFLELSQARGRRSLAEGGEADRETTEQLQKQASLFGQSTREIDHQIVLLKIRQDAERAGLEITDEAVKAREEEAKRLKEANDLIYRQQQLMEQVREVGTVFENAFGRAFDSIADGTFRLRKFLGDLLKDLTKTLASQAFKRILFGDSGGGEGGGIMGMLVGKLFGGFVGGGAGEGAGDFGGGGDIPAAATGGRWRVGGYGAIDSQLVAFRASPGEMIDVSQPGQYSGGSGEVIHINLNPSEGWVAGVADQRIVTRSGQIIDVAVKQSQRTVQRNFAGMSAEAQARTA